MKIFLYKTNKNNTNNINNNIINNNNSTKQNLIDDINNLAPEDINKLNNRDSYGQMTDGEVLAKQEREMKSLEKMAENQKLLIVLGLLFKILIKKEEMILI